ncbi:MAG: hypothetical protein JXQ65_06940 [Candidatus Marinimicrobia bacterium]|nr:hypothetical protein [Candidatus Neomarinimicrobiota bacterium]
MQNLKNYYLFDRAEELVTYISTQYGWDEKLLNCYNFYTINSGKIIFLLKGNLNITGNITQIGLPVYKGEFPRGYLSNTFLYRFGPYATKNVIEISEEDIQPLLNREGIIIRDNYSGSGPQIVKIGHRILGRGWIRNGQLYLDASKIWRQNLLGL